MIINDFSPYNLKNKYLLKNEMIIKTYINIFYHFYILTISFYIAFRYVNLKKFLFLEQQFNYQN